MMIIIISDDQSCCNTSSSGSLGGARETFPLISARGARASGRSVKRGVKKNLRSAVKVN